MERPANTSVLADLVGTDLNDMMAAAPPALRASLERQHSADADSRVAFNSYVDADA